jgi:hypothetical protein
MSSIYHTGGPFFDVQRKDAEQSIGRHGRIAKAKQRGPVPQGAQQDNLAVNLNLGLIRLVALTTKL